MGVIILFTIIAFQSVIIYLTCLILIRLLSREIITEMQKSSKKKKKKKERKHPALCCEIHYRSDLFK